MSGQFCTLAMFMLINLDLKGNECCWSTEKTSPKGILTQMGKREYSNFVLLTRILDNGKTIIFQFLTFYKNIGQEINRNIPILYFLQEYWATGKRTYIQILYLYLYKNIEPFSEIDTFMLINMFKNICVQKYIYVPEIFTKQNKIYLIFCRSDFCLLSCSCWNVRKTSDVDSEKKTI